VSLCSSIYGTINVCAEFHAFIVVFGQQSGDLRLVGDVEHMIGRLEIYFHSQWGTICIKGFTRESANTACRQLGRARAISFNEAVILGYVKLYTAFYSLCKQFCLIWAAPENWVTDFQSRLLIMPVHSYNTLLLYGNMSPN